jgi:hypothetical protein
MSEHTVVLQGNEYTVTRHPDGSFELPSELKKLQGWGTALKPSWEPVLVFRKPVEGTVSQNVLKHGTGGLNIDATRIGSTKRVPGGLSRTPGNSLSGSVDGRPNPNIGRWPANLVLVHSPECKVVGSKKVKAPVINRFDDGAKPFGDGAGHPYTSEQQGDEDGMEEVTIYECVEGCPVKKLDEQSGTLTSGKVAPHHMRNNSQHDSNGGFNGKFGDSPLTGFGDSGGASRFFGQFKPEAPFFYCSKVSKQEKEGWMQGKNPHPTVKPLRLMEWLVKLVTPRGAVVLDPYCGSGTTCVAAIMAECQYIGIEMDPEFHKLAELRLEALQDMAEARALENAQEELLEMLMSG